MGTEQATVPSEGLIARTAPNAAEKSTTRLEGMRTVTVLEQKGGWAKVETEEGLVGWVDGQRLLAHGDAPPKLGKAILSFVVGIAILGFFGIWGFLSLQDTIRGDCEFSGFVLHCRSGRLETWTNIPLFVIAALFGMGLVAAGIRGIARNVRSALFQRFVAWVIDAAGWSLLAVAIVQVTSMPFPGVLLTGGAIYALWGNASGQTLGRRLMHVAVVRCDSVDPLHLLADARVPADVVAAARPGWAKGLVRTLVGSLSIFYGIAHISALWSKKGGTLGDLAAKTALVKIAAPGARHELPPEGLAVRRTPNPTEEIVKRLDGGQEVVVVERKGVWARITTTDHETWWIDGRRLLPMGDRVTPG